MGGGTGVGNSLFRGTKGSQHYINKGKHDEHISGTNNYKQELEKGNHKSILTENPEKLLKNYAGKGVRISANKERADFRHGLGQYYNKETGIYVDTTLEYYACAVRIKEILHRPSGSYSNSIKVGGFIEISELNEPLRIGTVDGTVLWKK